MSNLYDMWRVFFEALPVLGALITIMFSIECAVSTIDSKIKNMAWLFAFCSILLVTAQSSWSWSLFIKHSLLGTDAANLIWTVFNITVMISMIYTLKVVSKK